MHNTDLSGALQIIIQISEKSQKTKNYSTKYVTSFLERKHRIKFEKVDSGKVRVHEMLIKLSTLSEKYL